MHIVMIAKRPFTVINGKDSAIPIDRIVRLEAFSKPAF